MSHHMYLLQIVHMTTTSCRWSSRTSTLLEDDNAILFYEAGSRLIWQCFGCIFAGYAQKQPNTFRKNSDIATGFSDTIPARD